MKQEFAVRFNTLIAEYEREEILRRLKNLDIMYEKCPHCGMPVFWVKNNSKKYTAVTPELYPHSSQCAKKLKDLF